ncbi:MULTISPECIES: cupin domain-containing protein [Chitinophagaceae]
MKRVLFVTTVLIAAIVNQAAAQDATRFFKDKLVPPPRTTPAAWLVELNKADSTFNFNTAVATFLPNTKLDWHNHPGGQILIITDGTGYYQEKGKPKQIVRTGDVIKCLPGVEHWHGASVETGVTYIAINPSQKGGTIWGKKVTDEEYNSVVK